MSELGPGPEFLKEKYNNVLNPDKTRGLHNAPEVQNSADFVAREEGIKINSPIEKIDAYLERLEGFFNDSDPKKRERKIHFLKTKLFDLLITKPEEISQNYGEFREEVIEERGQLGDWEAASEEQRQSIIREEEDALISDQRDSLETWVDYLSSDDATYPNWLKYWAFRSVSGLKEYDKKTKSFSKRSNGTIKMFPDLNHEALAYVLDAVEKKYQGQSVEIPYDIQEDEKARFQQFLKGENFSNLYAWAIENVNPIDQELLQVTEGKWVKFDQGTDPISSIPEGFDRPLVTSIRGKGTGWCTAGETTAKRQLQTGDFYVFYSNDQENTPSIPRIAIRMEQNKIAEVRGISYKQNLDPYVGEVLVEKLQEFPDKDEYLKKDHDMTRLTEIKNKTKIGEELNREDLEFLYEIKSKIQGFGYKDDPRIKELRNGRNLDADLPVLFDCEPSQIARTVEQVDQNTGAYIGEWNMEIFQKIRHFPQIEHLYESFPDKKIFMQSLKTDTSINSAETAENALQNRNDYISQWGKDILEKTEFSQESQKYDLVRFTVLQLGFTNGATTDEIYKKAEELGLELCPAEVGPQLRLQYRGGEWMLIAMKQIAGRDGHSDVFHLFADGGQLVLYGDYAYSSCRWNPDRRFVFRFRKDSQES